MVNLMIKKKREEINPGQKIMLLFLLCLAAEWTPFP